MLDYEELSLKLKCTLPEFFQKVDKPNFSKEELCIQLSKLIGVDIEFTESEAENIVCNYVYITNVVFKDLLEIDIRLNAIKDIEKTTPKEEDYKHKKLRYFAEINKEAKNQIVSFLSCELSKVLIDSKSYKYVERKDDGLTMLFLNGRYDYASFGRYYDPNYDFSTEVKIRFIPGVTPVNMLETVSEYIELKRNNPTKFDAKIDSMVSENNCINFISEIIKSHFYLQKRSELFDTLGDLYENGKYTSFISLAMTQLEGIFYDCVTILNKKELHNNAGTLVEKADKVFSDNQKIKQALYPYFAFSVPILRNEIAHNGITLCDNPYHICNEIILDIYCIVHWACRLSDDKYIAITMAYDKFQSEQESCCEKNISSFVFSDLFSSYQVCDREFIRILAKPTEYEDEIAFMHGLGNCDKSMTIKEKIERISNIVKSTDFWNYISNDILPHINKHESGKPYDVVDFIIHLRNAIIPVLSKDSTEKISCKNVSKLLKKFD